MFAILKNGYVTGFGISNAPEQSIEISEEQYIALRDSFKHCPICEDGYVAKLNLDGTWDVVEGEPQDIDDSEAFSILLGETE